MGFNPLGIDPLLPSRISRPVQSKSVKYFPSEIGKKLLSEARGPIGAGAASSAFDFWAGSQTQTV